MELVDKFDNKRQPLNISRERFEKIKGEYNQSVHVWIINSNNELLIQKRSETKRVYPGMWAITGGAVDSGELPITALYREIKEELGITVTPDETELLLSLARTYDFVDVYLVKKDIDINEIIMQPETRHLYAKCTLTLRNLIRMMNWNMIYAAAVNINWLA